MELNQYTSEIIITISVLFLVFILRLLVAKAVRRYAKINQNLEQRTKLVIKYIDLLINIVALIALIVIWGVQKEDILVTVSSITTVIGVALFAQWSILSNITSGIILFFFFPFKIGDTIRINDKDFPVQGEIEDINSFHINIRSLDGERSTYPNNLLLQKGITILKTENQHVEFMD